MKIEVASLAQDRKSSVPNRILISGGMGAGKGTIIKEVLPWADEHLFPESGITFSRSWTTRDRRPQEDPQAYNFVSREEFEKAIANGCFVEWTEHSGNMYGTPRMDESPHLIELEVKGAREIFEQNRGNNMTMLYIAAENAQTLFERLMQREDGMDPQEKIRRFARVIKEEMPLVADLPYHIIINQQRHLELAILQAKLALSGTYFNCLHEKDAYIEQFIKDGEQILAT